MEAALETWPIWSPNQLRSLAIMGLDESLRPVGERPFFDTSLPQRFRSRLEDLLAPTIEAGGYTAVEPLVIRKYDLAEVLRCETTFVERIDEPFEWSLPKARGTILHKAQQASVTRRGAAMAAPIIVEQAIERFKHDPDAPIAPWLNDLSDFEIEELTVDVTECLVKLRSDLPPVQPHWQPRCESRARVELCDQRCVLLGKFDLALGMPRGLQARTFITDFKTGGIRIGHLDELRFYALLETFRSKVPPWRAAVYYIDVGEWSYIDVNEDGLTAAVKRIAEGAARIAALTLGTREPASCIGPCASCRIVEPS